MHANGLLCSGGLLGDDAAAMTMMAMVAVLLFLVVRTIFAPTTLLQQPHPRPSPLSSTPASTTPPPRNPRIPKPRRAAMVCNGPCSPAVDDESRRDRISNLPDDLLLRILVLVPLVEVVRTSVLSRRWVHVWTRLPMLEFADDEASPVASFANLVAGVIRGYATDVDMPDVLISVRGCFQYTLDEAVRIAASAFLVAQRATTTTTRTGVFEKLTKLYIFGVQFTDGGDGINNAIIRQCPCHQDLELHRVEGIKMLFLLSESLLRLRLYKVMDLERLLVTAKNLREMEVTKCFVMMAIERTWIWLTLPKLEKLHWEDCCPDEIQRWSLPSQIWNLTIVELSRGYLQYCGGGQSHFTRILQAFDRTDILRLEIPIAPVSIYHHLRH
ncbi:hypothetical protein PR202_gb21160 [Eleusine coracana subsp. coracana]|uniref:F-box domain-containing protein n=1 Tax=Eleusine coracana subsp. coracana TaxID=191504 RepID=A0AAV5FCM9_ELECO|nr:hypothetical protein PR202_gb21160 [Eleusine coracana subsp. coracana]